MIDPISFLSELENSEVKFFTGVPDSLLKEVCACIDDKKSRKDHIISANEGTAVATALGYHLATKKVPLVYMQNSGLGNIVNPITSLCDKEVYSIPMVLLIGWRGEPGKKDEPQHIKKGRITEGLLNELEIPFSIIDSNSDYINIIKDTVESSKDSSRPVALLVRKGTFSKYNKSSEKKKLSNLSREVAIDEILKNIDPSDLIVSTTGKTSRELYELRVSRGEKTSDFLTVGGMGHTSSIALGVALNTKKRVICLDGDGSMLMHMGAISNIGNLSPNNLVHIILNNGAHESVGGQETVASEIDIQKIMIGNGYENYFCVENLEEISAVFNKLKSGLTAIEVKIKTGAREDLGRPKSTPIENKLAFMESLHGSK